MEGLNMSTDTVLCRISQAALDSGEDRSRALEILYFEYGAGALPLSELDEAMEDALADWGEAPDQYWIDLEARCNAAYRRGQLERAKAAIEDYLKGDDEDSSPRPIHLIHVAAQATSADDGSYSTRVTAPDIVDLASRFVDVDDREDALWDAKEALAMFHYQTVISDGKVEARDRAEASSRERLAEASNGAELADIVHHAAPAISREWAAEIAADTIRGARADGDAHVTALFEADRAANDREFLLEHVIPALRKGVPMDAMFRGAALACARRETRRGAVNAVAQQRWIWTALTPPVQPLPLHDVAEDEREERIAMWDAEPNLSSGNPCDDAPSADSAAETHSAGGETLDDMLARIIGELHERPEETIAIENLLSWQRVGTPNGAGKAAPRISATPFVLRDPKTLPRRQWLYGTHLIRCELGVTFAPGGVGKTSLGMVEALALATGWPLLGIKPPKPQRVWLFNGEEPADEMERRIGAICLHYGIKAEDIGDRLFVDNGNDTPIVLAESSRDGTKIFAPKVDGLIAAIREREIDVMIVDPFVSTHHAAENDNGAMQQVASAWKRVAVETNIAIALAHHTRKLNGQAATADDGRGAAALKDKARDVRVLNPMTRHDAAMFGVSMFDRQRHFWTGPDGKSNMSLRTDEKTWFRMETVDLENCGPGNLEVGEKVGVVTHWTPPVAEAPRFTDEQVAELAKVMKGGTWRAAPNLTKAHDWIGRAVATVFEPDLAEGWEHRAKDMIKALEAALILQRMHIRNTAKGVDVPVYVLGSGATKGSGGEVSDEADVSE